MTLEKIAHIENDFDEKFGIPRQSGLCGALSKIVFEKKFADKNAVRGLEDFSHIWLIWGFSEFEGKGYSPTVRPPKLGGNERRGVFATRSPNRPNALGLSAVKLEKILADGSLEVSGADLMNGSPIYDIKPYLKYADCVENAANGFAEPFIEKKMDVEIPAELARRIPEEKLGALAEILAHDPRPQYQNDPQRIYTMSFGGQQISFRANSEKNLLTVTDVKRSASVLEKI